MTVPRLLFTAFTAMLITGCQLAPIHGDATQSPQPTNTELANSEQRLFVLVQPEQTGLQRVMDDGVNQYLWFNAPIIADTAFFDDAGQSITVIREGATIGIPGLRKGILIRRGDTNTYIARREGGKPQATPQPGDREIINRLREQIAEQGTARAAMLAALAATVPSPTRDENVAVKLPSQRSESARAIASHTDQESKHQVLPDGRQLMTLYFRIGGASVARPKDRLNRLEILARNAKHIDICGFADALGEREANRTLGLQRAESVAQYLIARGIPEHRVNFHSHGANDFAADNALSSGRALNRRVEVRISPKQVTN